ncbi:MAG: (Fe-S)-binding protein [Myxococcota bacterium]
MSGLERYDEATTLCLYCPSLCHHACPVARVEGRDTVTPWALMSLVHHVAHGQVRLTGDVAESWYHCTGCRACTEACAWDNDVEDVLVAARQYAVSHGARPFPTDSFRHDQVAEHEWWQTGPRSKARYKMEPSVLLLPGHRDLLEDCGAVESLLGVCERFDEDELSTGDASHLDVGYDLWASGQHREFVDRARKVGRALEPTRHVVVMSPEALYTLRELYPRCGVHVDAELMHTSEFILPFLAGAIIERVEGRVAFHDSCHLARHLGSMDVPRELLRRVLAQPLVELQERERNTVCCGGTGCLPITAPETAGAMARQVVELALEAGADRLVTFAPECVCLLREAAGDDLRVDDAILLVDEAVSRDET